METIESSLCTSTHDPLNWGLAAESLKAVNTLSKSSPEDLAFSPVSNPVTQQKTCPNDYLSVTQQPDPNSTGHEYSCKDYSQWFPL
ncbi:hypothetical protein FCV25MIE_05683 [Fagus crenata]